MEKRMDLTTFTDPITQAAIRTASIDGEPWVIAKDLAEALGYTWNGSARIEHVPEEWRGVTSVVTPSGVQDMAILSEQGVYFFLARSDKPWAIQFQKWIAGEVVPAIRKTGGYSAAIPQSYADALQLAADQARQIDTQTKALALAAPAVAFVDRYTKATGSEPLRVVAKLLKISERRFVRFLEDRKIMYRLGGKLTPFAQHVDAGRFEVTPGEANGHAFAQARFTPEGIRWVSALVGKLEIAAVAA
jgi:phage antirepressor YoqD-like protein